MVEIEEVTAVMNKDFKETKKEIFKLLDLREEEKEITEVEEKEIHLMKMIVCDRMIKRYLKKN